MGHQSYVLRFSSEEEKQRILDVIKKHNSFYDGATEEEINDPNFEAEVGEELFGIVSAKLLKSKPKMYANYTHAILCGNGGGRGNTFKWFFKHHVNCVPYTDSCSKWISKRSLKPEALIKG